MSAFPFINDIEDVRRESARHWVWRCPVCKGPDDETNSKSILFADSVDPSSPDFKSRYEYPALSTLDSIAEQHFLSVHPAGTR